MSTWQPIETCPENTWVLVHEEWNNPDVAVSKFAWKSFSEWETVSESSGASGARRQIRQEKVFKNRVWDNGIGEMGDGGYHYWMPLPEPPVRAENK